MRPTASTLASTASLGPALAQAVAPALGSDALSAGTLVGSWRVEHELGRGGMGTVYAVRHVVIGKAAALKVVHRDVLVGGYTVGAVLTEAKAVNAFSHPNVVDIFETGTMTDGRPFLVMERLTGRTLGDRHDEGRVPALEAIAYLVPLCEALAAAHAAGIIHRDVKLDNVFLEEVRSPHLDGRSVTIVKLLDWGVASMLGSDGSWSGDDLMIGTPRYVAPEQARGERATTASDVFSLGVVAYELFLEASPFTGATTSGLLLAHVHDAPLMPREVWPRIPPTLEQLLLAMLSKEAAARPSALAVADVLIEVRDQLRRDSGEAAPERGRLRSARPDLVRAGAPAPRMGSDRTRSVMPPARASRPWRWPAAAGLVAVIVGLSALLWTPVSRLPVATAATSAAPLERASTPVAIVPAPGSPVVRATPP